MKRSLEQIEKEMRLRNFSHKTIKAYLHAIEELLSFYQKSPKDITDQQIKDFLLSKLDQGYSAQTVSLYLNAFNYLYRSIYKQPREIGIKHPKRNKSLPVVLSKNEVNAILQATANPKHRLLLALAYGSGLRVGEAVSLKIRDINLDEGTLMVRGGKGRKDRLTLISDKIKPDIEKISSGKKPDDYLIESERGGRLTERSAQKVFGNSLNKAGIKKNATFHPLRHSFATHLLENGVDIRYIQELLGHQNIRTTQIYTKVTNPAIRNIKSPL